MAFWVAALPTCRASSSVSYHPPRRRPSECVPTASLPYNDAMNFNFREHDRAIESSPERQQLSAALSRLHKARVADENARTLLQQARTTSMHGMSGRDQRLHGDRFADLQRVADECGVELEVAKAVADRLRSMLHTKKIEGRVEVHTQLTANIVGAVRTLQDAVATEQKFREQLRKDGLRFERPLRSMAAYERGGPGWVDGLMPTIAAWLKEMQRGDPYHILSRAPATKPKLRELAHSA